MEDIAARRAIELSWKEACRIAEAEIGEILNIHVPCGVSVTGTEFWALTFEGCRLSLPKLCQLLQAVQATPGDWEEALPDEGEADVGAIGMVQAEKLIGRHLNLCWRYRVITADSLWLVGVEEANDADSQRKGHTKEGTG